MDKQTAEEQIKRDLKEGDSLIGFFQAMEFPKIWLYFLVGPFASFGLKQYYVAVSTLGIYFYKLSLSGKFDTHDFFEYKEIESLQFGKGMVQRPLKLYFKNGRKVNMKAQLKGVEKVAKLTEDVQRHMERNIPLKS